MGWGRCRLSKNGPGPDSLWFHPSPFPLGPSGCHRTAVRGQVAQHQRRQSMTGPNYDEMRACQSV
uniref:Uncharacterized protein n=1 Tax=Oryza sativa subsp. japonica TaxID=39947 RepID=Q69N56_ORYSJ|nr:hypothetical protein [Oryza sativa Japonica Group]